MSPPRNSRTARVRAATRCSGPRLMKASPEPWSSARPTVTAAGCRIYGALRANASVITEVEGRPYGVSWGSAVRAAPGAARCQGERMSHPDPALVDVRTLAAHPLVDNGPTSTLRMVAPGAVTRGRYGLVEYRVAPHSAGAAPHYHQTFSESFYVLTGELTIYADGSWQPYRPGDFALVHETGVHGFRNDGDEETSFL